jgi:hypothetical protein
VTFDHLRQVALGEVRSDGWLQSGRGVLPLHVGYYRGLRSSRWGEADEDVHLVVVLDPVLVDRLEKALEISEQPLDPEHRAVAGLAPGRELTE